MMRQARIVVISTGLIVVITVLCSLSCADDQPQTLIEAAMLGDLKQVQKTIRKGSGYRR